MQIDIEFLENIRTMSYEVIAWYLASGHFQHHTRVAEKFGIRDGNADSP